MIKVKAIEDFTLKDFDKLKNIKRARYDEEGKLFVNDEFECDEEMAKYLTGGNAQKKVVVKVIEVMPKELKKAEQQIEGFILTEKAIKEFEEKPKKSKKSKK